MATVCPIVRNNASLCSLQGIFNTTATRLVTLHQLIRNPFLRMYSSHIKRGDIFVIQHSRKFEKGDVVSSKDSKRPGLVISSNTVIEKTNRVVLANITGSTARIYPFEVYVQADKRNGLDKNSKVMTNQLYTLPKTALIHPEISKKKGRLNFLDQKKVDDGLRISLSSIHDETKPRFSRGAVVLTNDSSGNLVHGVIVSNDIGNMRSKIVILSPASRPNIEEELFQIDVQVYDEQTLTNKIMRVDCNEIDSAPQTILKVVGKISEVDMQMIESRIFLGLALND